MKACYFIFSKSTVISRELLTRSLRRRGGGQHDKSLEKVNMCDYPQETILNFYKCKDEKITVTPPPRTMTYPPKIRTDMRLKFSDENILHTWKFFSFVGFGLKGRRSPT